MPCDSSHLKQSDREIELQRAARLYCWLRGKLYNPARIVAQEAAASCYGNGFDATPYLCAALRGLSAGLLDAIVYDAHDRTARDLASWWEDHCEADRKKEGK